MTNSAPAAAAIRAIPHYLAMSQGRAFVLFTSHRLLERADVPLKTVELVYAALGSGLLAGVFFAVAGMSTLVTLVAMVVAGSLPILIGWPAVGFVVLWCIIDLFLIPGMVRADREDIRRRLR